MKNVLRSIQTICWNIGQYKITEIILQIKELWVFLVEINLPLQVWINEVQPKQEKYNLKNILINWWNLCFSWEMDVPKQTFLTLSAKQIIDHFLLVTYANYTYIIIVQSIDDAASSIYGTDGQ